MSKSKPYLKIWLNPDDDKDIAEWWDSLPLGERSKLAREVLRAGLQVYGTDTTSQQQQIDLGAIRQIFESVLDSKLSNLSFVQHSPDEDEDEDDPLQSLDDSFLLE